MNTFHLKIASSKGVVFDSDVARISLRTVTGDIAVLANHIPYASVLKSGICKITDADGNDKFASYSDGIITVNKNVTNVLVTTFQWS